MTTVIPALIAAAAALIVAVIERVFVHRSELREQQAAVRREAYSEFLSAQLTAQIYELGNWPDGGMAPEHMTALDRSSRALCIIRLAAPLDVVEVADAYHDAMYEWSVSPSEETMTAAAMARERFEAEARTELDTATKSLPVRMAKAVRRRSATGVDARFK